MSDFSLGIDFSELQAAGVSVREFGNLWATAVNKIVAENNKLNRAYGASGDAQA